MKAAQFSRFGGPEVLEIVDLPDPPVPPTTTTFGSSAQRPCRTAPDGVDAALDVAGSGVLPELIDLAGGPQNVVTLADVDGAKQHEVRFSNGFQGHAFHAPAEIGALIEAGRFWLPVERTYPLCDLGSAPRQ